MSETPDTPSPQPASQDPSQTGSPTDQQGPIDQQGPNDHQGPNDRHGPTDDQGPNDQQSDEQSAETANIETMVAEWKTELEGQQSVSASNVQDRLLDMWGQLPEGSVRSEIEKWLTETVQRQLYAVADIDARLQRVLADA